MSRFVEALVVSARSDKGMTTGVPHAPVRTSWADVHAAARRGAAALAHRGVAPGDAVAVLAGLPAEVAPAVQAVWLAGGSVTMLHQPTARTDLARYAADTLAALTMIHARTVIVGEPFTEVAGLLAERGFAAIDARQLMDPAAPSAPLPEPDAIAEDSPALLQLTSGSTAAPKAVEITHGGLWANISGMATVADLDPARDVMVSWLPLFHDMGMVGFFTVPMCRGIEAVVATPGDFLASPLMWMQLIDRYRGTVTAAPNFAYALAARVLPRASGLDLSCLRFALNGAEPVDIAAVRRFLAAGAPFGLPATAVVPAYGMAEATLGVAFHPWGTPLSIDVLDARSLEEDGRAVPAMAGDDEAVTRQFPLLGPPLPGIEVQARGAGGAVLAAREVGTLFLRGESITRRYLTVDGPVDTRGADGWLDTGDLGYLTESGAVVVTGRVKDVIIMGGRNIYPTDIERVAQTVTGVRAGNAAAVRLDVGERRESFAVIVESKMTGDEAESDRISREVRGAVTAQMGVRPARVLVVPPGTLPKTPSGKIRRAAAAGLVAAG